jgi:hypothetical protein
MALPEMDLKPASLPKTALETAIFRRFSGDRTVEWAQTG